MSVYKKALLDIYAAMGPKAPNCLRCPGCRAEWSYALEAIEKALGEKELKKLFPWHQWHHKDEKGKAKE